MMLNRWKLSADRNIMVWQVGGCVRIGVIGWEDEALSLARSWSQDHHIIFGLADPHSLRAAELEEALPKALVLDIEDASGADLLVLAVPAAHLVRTALMMGDLEGRILVDCSWGPEDPHLGKVSAAEALQQLMPNARVVRGIPFSDWSEPKGLHLCGDEQEAVDLVADLFLSVGWQVSRPGGLRRTRSLRKVHASPLTAGPVHRVS